MKNVFLVAGIDTGIGKTIVTGLMARYLLGKGIDAITVKLVQTGNDGFSEDIIAHRRICGDIHFNEDDLGVTRPQVFKFPSSPELAARLEGRVVDLERIISCVDFCAARHEVVLVEAAGGLHVPLTHDLLTIDFAARYNWKTILVTCGRLGSINHTLLSVEALKSRGMELAGLVYNYFPGVDPVIDADTPQMAQEFMRQWGIDAPVICVGEVSPDGPYPDIDFTPVFRR